MQLAHQPVWYFIFGPKQKSSLASQYALEHRLQHLVNPSETTLHEHEKKGLIIESSLELFRAVEKWKAEITVIFVRGEYSAEEKAVKREYEMIGRAKFVGEVSYAAFRKELYPQLIILYGPSQVVLEVLYKNYFCYIGYQLIITPVTANDLISKYAKHENYILVDFTPEPAEITILETYFHLKIVHLKHERTQLSGKQDYFDREATIVPVLEKKACFHSISGQQQINSIIRDIGKKLLPELIFANVHEAEDREIVRKYVEETDGLLLNIFDIQPILRRKPNKGKPEPEKMEILCSVVFKNLNRNEIIFTDYPWTPEEFYEFQGHTRTFKLFADFVKPENYQFSKSLNSSIYFLEKMKRRQIEHDIPFETQLKTYKKYLFVTGAPCAGKTTASKYIASEFGYKHIEYDSYVASIKEKLIAPEDGEELPFRKIIAHFNTLVAESGNSPLVIDGINLDLKEVQNWVKVVGPPTVLNLKVEEKELIRRTRRKNQADVNAEVGEEEAAKIKESIAKNLEWTDQFANKSPLSRLYQIDFNQQILIAEQLLKDLLQPRVYLIEQNNTFLYQNLAIRHNFGFFNLHHHSFRTIGDLIRTGHYRDVIICNYRQINDDLISKDFHWLEKNIGIIRYLSIWSGEDAETKDEIMQLERPQQVEKPKPAEGEEAEAPPAEEDGEAKKKAFNIYDYTWTKPGNHKNMSQWFFKQKRDPVTLINTFNQIAAKGLGFSIEHLAKRRENEIFHKVTA